MSHHIVPGATVRGPFTAATGVKNTLETLVDKHCVVLAVQGGKAMCVYTGSDADVAFKQMASYLEVPSHANAAAGWKVSRKFYVDAAKICIIPVDMLEVEGSVSQGFLRTVVAKVQSLRNVTPTHYNAAALERRTGHVREVANGIR